MNQEFLENIGIEVANVNGEEIQFKCPFHDDLERISASSSINEESEISYLNSSHG